VRSGRRPAGRRRRAGPVAHYGAPAAFLLAATVAILLIHAALGGKTTPGRVATTVRSTPVATTTRTTKPKPTKPAASYYVIQRGDTFGAVAAKFHVSVGRIQALNPGVSSNSLRVGQRIRVR
jgi:LysM repeat protein